MAKGISLTSMDKPYIKVEINMLLTKPKCLKPSNQASCYPCKQKSTSSIADMWQDASGARGYAQIGQVIAR